MFIWHCIGWVLLGLYILAFAWYQYKDYKEERGIKMLAKLEDGYYIKIHHSKGKILHF
jgi:hypothetical protein